MPETVLNHDHLNFDEVRKNQAVHALSRLTPTNTSDEETLEVLLDRSKEVAKGMRFVLQQEFQEFNDVQQ
jgi:hypothetical protein